MDPKDENAGRVVPPLWLFRVLAVALVVCAAYLPLARAAGIEWKTRSDANPVVLGLAAAGVAWYASSVWRNPDRSRFHTRVDVGCFGFLTSLVALLAAYLVFDLVRQLAG